VLGRMDCLPHWGLTSAAGSECPVLAGTGGCWLQGDWLFWMGLVTGWWGGLWWELECVSLQTPPMAPPTSSTHLTWGYVWGLVSPVVCACECVRVTGVPVSSWEGVEGWRGGGVCEEVVTCFVGGGVFYGGVVGMVAMAYPNIVIVTFILSYCCMLQG